MVELLSKYLPNVVDRFPDFLKSIRETFYMTGYSGLISFAIGLILGIILVVTKEGGIMENKPLYWIVDKVTNLFRSIPFIILLAALIPLTRLISGTSIGTTGTIVPLVFGATPFFARQIETALLRLDDGLIEAAQSMGLSSWSIIFRVYLKESIPALTNAITITIISLIGLTAMAGAVGGGGIGNFAIRFGHERNMLDITYASVAVLLLIVSIIQGIGSIIAKKNTH